MKIFSVAIACFILSSAFSQHAENNAVVLKVGEPLPKFELKNVKYFERTVASSENLKGKWLFLDFWYQGCSTCINSFSKVNDLYSEFNKEITWLLVGINDHKYNKGIEQLYSKLQAKKNLRIPVAFDSLVATQWDIHSFPYIVIVNPSGRIHAITGGRDITREKIKKLIAGEKVDFLPKDFNEQEITKSEVADSSRILYRSLITKWNGEQQYAGIEMERWVKWPVKNLRQGYRIELVPLYALYNYAYLGKWTWDFKDSLYNIFYPTPMLEMKDSSGFDYDFATKGVVKGMFNYYLTLPVTDITVAKMKEVMQEDLKRSFGYKVTLQEKEMAVWKLVARPGVAQKLKSKGGNSFITQGVMVNGFKLTNYDHRFLIGCIRFYLASGHNEPFIDETGITENIDFTIEADMSDIDDVKKELRKQGLDLIKGKRKMMVLVIAESDRI